MVPRWQVFLTKPGLPELPALMDLAHELRLRERVADLGAEFVVFCHPPGPSGEGWHIRHLGITEPDLTAVPSELMDSTIKHFGGRVDWITEAEALRRLESGEVIEPYVPEEPWFLVDAVLDVYTNYAAEIAPAWRLGNFRSDSLDTIMPIFEQNATPGLAAAFHTPYLDLGRRWSDPANPHIWAFSDIPDIWIHRHVEHDAAQSA